MNILGTAQKGLVLEFQNVPLLKRALSLKIFVTLKLWGDAIFIHLCCAISCSLCRVTLEIVEAARMAVVGNRHMMQRST